MDEKLKNKHETSWPSEPPIKGSISQAVSPKVFESKPMQTSTLEIPKVNKSLVALLVVTFLLGANFIGLILGDVFAGVLSGKAETGWGVMAAVFFVGPPLLVFGAITLLRIRRFKNNGQKIGRTIKLAGIISAVILAVYGLFIFGIYKYDEYSSRNEKAQAVRQHELNKNETITIAYATELLSSCKVRAYYYGDIIKSSSIKSELAKQNVGVVLVKLNGSPNNIQVSNDANVQLLAIAENAKKICSKFSINGE